MIKPEWLDYVESAISLKDITALLGDEGFFMGFPYGLSTSDRGNTNAGFPLPLLKKAVFSGNSLMNDIYVLLLDGHNNPGFSGGPVLFKDRLKSGDNKYHLIGVISAYVNQKNEMTVILGLKN